MTMKKAVIDIENLEVFPSLEECAEALKVTPAAISRNIYMGYKSKGRKLEHLEEWKLWENKTKEKHTRKNNIFFY